MSWDEDGRKYFIAFSYGVWTTKDSKFIDHEESRIQIDQELIAMNQPAMSQAEEEIFELIDNVMYLFRLGTANRFGFRKVIKK